MTKKKKKKKKKKKEKKKKEKNYLGWDTNLCSQPSPLGKNIESKR